MNLFVTGGAGFIGSNFIRYILNKYPSYKILNLDKLTYAGNLDNLKDVKGNRNYKFFKGDICDFDLVTKLSKGKDVIINFAAESHVDRSIHDADDFLRTNLLGTYQLLQAAKINGLKRFIQISTDEVYGSVACGSSTEADPISPRSPYSASKAAADLLALSYYSTHNLPVIVTRSSNNFGPYQYPEKVVPLFITNAIDDKPLPLYGDGLNIRDWLYVIDNCEAINLVMHKGKTGEIYNIGADCEKTNRELTGAVLKILDKPKSLIKYVSDRLGHDRRYSLNSAKIHKLGWKPRHNFKKALSLTVNWYKENEIWWRKIKNSGVFKKHYIACYRKRH